MPNQNLSIFCPLLVKIKFKIYLIFLLYLQNAKDVSVGGADEIVKEVIGKAGHYVDHEARLKTKVKVKVKLKLKGKADHNVDDNARPKVE